MKKREWFSANWKWRWKPRSLAMVRDGSLVEFNRLYNGASQFDSYNGSLLQWCCCRHSRWKRTSCWQSEGLQVVNLENNYGIEHQNLMVHLYITRDLAAALYRKNEYQFAKIYLLSQWVFICPTSSNSRQYYKKWTMIGAKTLSCSLDW